MRAVKELDLGIEQWASNLSLSIRRISNCVSPDLILLGGGVTEEPDDWLGLMDVDHPIYIAPGPIPLALSVQLVGVLIK